MDLPIRLPETPHPWRSAKVAVSWADPFASRTLEIQVGLLRSDQHGRPAPPGAGRTELTAYPRRISGVLTQETPVSGGIPKSPYVSENENTAVVNFWNSLSAEQQQAFIAMADKRSFAAGARLMQEGERANHVAVILDGWTEIRVRKNDGERVVARRGPGQLIGERAALQISVRSATVVAIQPVDALVMHTEDFAAFVSEHEGVLGIVENQIFNRMKEEPAAAEPDRLPAVRPRLLKGENCTILLTDVVAFGADERNDEDREIIRRATSDMTRLALSAAWDTCRCEDRGDGELIILPPGIPTAQAMEWLLAVLPRELRRHNRIYSERIRMQLRVAVDVGPITEDARGVSGQSIIRAARMIDAPAFKQAIATEGALLGLVASPWVYDTVIRQSAGSLDPASYTEIPVRVKETRGSAWMRLIEPSRTAVSSLGTLGRDGDDRAVRVVQDRVGDRAGAVQAVLAGVPADDDQVGPGGQAGQRPARVTVEDLLADLDAGILFLPPLDQGLQPVRELLLHRVPAGRAQRGKGPLRAGSRDVPGVHGEQGGLAQGGLLERELQGVGAGVGVADADGDLPVRGRGLVADDDDRAGRVGGRVPADRPEDQGRERAGAAGPDDQHQRARAALGDRKRGRPGQVIGVDQQVGGYPRGALRGRGQGDVALLDQGIGHDLEFLPLLLAFHHPGQQRRAGNDPQRGAAQHRLPGRPVDRPQ
jgi:hypothetical protein